MQLVYIGIGVAVAIGAAVLLKGKSKKKKNKNKKNKPAKRPVKFHRRTPTVEEPWMDKELKRPIRLPPVAPQPPVVITPPVAVPPPVDVPVVKDVEPTMVEPHAGPKPPPPEPDEGYPPAPTGWYRAPYGFLYKDPDPKALWNFDIAYRTKRIDFSRFQKPIKYNFAYGSVRPEKLHNHIIQLPDEDFMGQIAGDTQNNVAVSYLCDSKGFVHDVCISAMGASPGWQTILYAKGAFKNGKVFVVQVADGPGLCVAYHPISSDRWAITEADMNQDIFKK